MKQVRFKAVVPTGAHSSPAYLSSPTTCRLRRFNSEVLRGYPDPPPREAMHDPASELRRTSLPRTPRPDRHELADVLVKEDA